MSKEIAQRFFMTMEMDEKIKKAFNVIISKYEGKNLSADEMDMVVREAVIPLAKEYGFEFSPEDLAALYKEAGEKLSDQELGAVAGGRGQYSHTDIKFGPFGPEKITYFRACNSAPDDQTFNTYYDQDSNNCPDYWWNPRMPHRHICTCCQRLEDRTTKGPLF